MAQERLDDLLEKGTYRIIIKKGEVRTFVTDEGIIVIGNEGAIVIRRNIRIEMEHKDRHGSASLWPGWDRWPSRC